MINWIKSFFVTETKERKPKCYKCGLGASVIVLMEFQTLGMEELEDKILTKVCNECFEEIHANYNPDWIPKPIKGDKNE
tara:strand:- start:1304 stop:1540 length:237 start_codon:yes stop_codon:yes gene_type:complete